MILPRFRLRLHTSPPLFARRRRHTICRVGDYRLFLVVYCTREGRFKLLTLM
jgi:hypothetical protein